MTFCGGPEFLQEFSGAHACFKSNGFGLRAFHKNRFWGKLEVQLADITNVENIPGTDETRLEFTVELGCKLPPYGWGF